MSEFIKKDNGILRPSYVAKELRKSINNYENFYHEVDYTLFKESTLFAYEQSFEEIHKFIRVQWNDEFADCTIESLNNKIIIIHDPLNFLKPQMQDYCEVDAVRCMEHYPSGKFISYRDKVPRGTFGNILAETVRCIRVNELPVIRIINFFDVLANYISMSHLHINFDRTKKLTIFTHQKDILENFGIIRGGVMHPTLSSYGFQGILKQHLRVFAEALSVPISCYQNVNVYFYDKFLFPKKSVSSSLNLFVYKNNKRTEAISRIVKYTYDDMIKAFSYYMSELNYIYKHGNIGPTPVVYMCMRKRKRIKLRDFICKLVIDSPEHVNQVIGCINFNESALKESELVRILKECENFNDNLWKYTDQLLNIANDIMSKVEGYEIADKELYRKIKQCNRNIRPTVKLVKEEDIEEFMSPNLSTVKLDLLQLWLRYYANSNDSTEFIKDIGKQYIMAQCINQARRYKFGNKNNKKFKLKVIISGVPLGLYNTVEKIIEDKTVYLRNMYSDNFCYEMEDPLYRLQTDNVLLDPLEFEEKYGQPFKKSVKDFFAYWREIYKKDIDEAEQE